MNSAQLVNLIIQKLQRVEFVVIQTNTYSIGVWFKFDNKTYRACVDNFYFRNYVALRCGENPDDCTKRLEDVLNGKVELKGHLVTRC